jgi:outer membrane immunogenic protein
VKGGAAVTNNEYDGALALNVPAGAFRNKTAFGLTATDHASAVRFGEVIGTGVDVMLAPGWSLGVEYNHLFMGSQTVGFAYTGAAGTGALAGLVNSPAGVPSRNETISGDIDMATVRLNYSFGR